jgi:hypothetical protein
MQPVSKQRLGKHVPAETNARAIIEERCFLCGPRRDRCCAEAVVWAEELSWRKLALQCSLTLHKALIKSVITYAFPAWELAAGTYLLKLQRMQNRGLCTIVNFPICTPARDLHTGFNLPYVYDYIIKLCRQQADVIRIMRMNMFAV